MRNVAILFFTSFFSGSLFAQIAYVPNTVDNSVSVFDLDSPFGLIDTIELGPRPLPPGPPPPPPFGLTLSPDGSFAYVVNGYMSLLYIIDTTSREVMEVPLGPGFPKKIDVTPNGDKVVITDFIGEKIWVVTLWPAPLSIDTFYIGSFPINVRIHPDGTRAYVARVKENTLTVINIRLATFCRKFLSERVATGSL